MSTPEIRAKSSYPCRCLWRGFEQMTITRPWRRITLHFSHIFLTLGLTFMFLLVPVGDPTSAEVVGRELHLHPVPREDADVVHAHLAGDVGQHLVAVVQFDAEHGVGERFHDGALQHDRVFLGFRQMGLLKTASQARWKRQPGPGQSEILAQSGTVNTSGPSSVTAMVCSKWAERLPSAVTTVQPSSLSRVPGPPALTIGSTASTWPTLSLIPRPGGP